MGCCCATIDPLSTSANRTHIGSFMVGSPPVTCVARVPLKFYTSWRQFVRSGLGVLLLTEYLTQQSCCLCRRVFANLALFLTHYVKESIHSFPDHILINAEVLIFRHTRCDWVLDQLVVFLHHTYIFHRAMHDRGERCCELVSAGG